MWLKFYFFDSSLSPRFSLTFLTFAGGAGVLSCVVAPAALLPRPLRGPCLIALDAALSLLILTDALYLRYSADLFSLYNLGLYAQAGDVSDAIIALIEPQDAKYFVDIPFLALLSRAISREGGWRWLSIKRASAALVLATLGASCAAWKMHSYDRAVPGAIRSLWDRPAVAISVGSLVYHAADAMNVAGERIAKKHYSKEEEDELAGWIESRAAQRAGSRGATFGVAAGKNLIMIQVESLQAFVVGLAFGGTEVTPNINRFARNGIHFTRAFNQTAGGNSSDAEFMSNASLFPTAKGAAFARFAGNAFITLGTELASRGYETTAFHGDKPGFWNRNHMYPALGFERFISKNEFAPGEGIGLGLSDRDFFRQSLEYLEDIKDDGPFYAFLITLTSHHPFNFGAFERQAIDIQLGELEGTVPGNYLRAIHYADAQIGNFLNGLERDELLDNSLIVIYGDHPAIPRGDADRLGALLGRDISSAAAWRDIQSIPIIMRLPRGEYAGKSDAPAGQIDIAPTVASLMGFTIASAFGEDLLAGLGELSGRETSEKMTVFRNGSFVKGYEWVQPGDRRAVDLRTNKTASWSEKTASDARQAAELLAKSDMFIELDMARKIRLDYRR
jgi:phosphoglycerol transferase MdoB-like AlkP superfamily enzyme